MLDFLLRLLQSRILWMLFLANWCVGICFVQYFYYRTRRLRKLDNETKERYAPFVNSPEKWNRLVHTLMSCIMIPRIVGFLTATITCSIAVWFIRIGSGSKIRGWRRVLVGLVSRVFGRMGLFCGSYIWITHQYDDIDYSKWLGKDWKKNGPNHRAPFIISNHRTWSDILLFMTTKEFPSYLSSMHIKNLPFYGFLAESYGSFFVKRGNEESRNDTLNEIRRRAKEIIEDEDAPQLVIFPEGGTSNGQYLLRFKRGAFEPELPIQPFFFEFYSPYCNPACEIIPIHLSILFMACQPFTILTVRRMPVVYPTKFMYDHFGNIKDASKAEIYTNVVRDIYSESYGLKKVDNSQMEKVELKKFIYDTEALNNN